MDEELATRPQAFPQVNTCGKEMDEELATRPQAFPQVTQLLVKSVSEELATRNKLFR
jgi:hypothetical protein